MQVLEIIKLIGEVGSIGLCTLMVVMRYLENKMMNKTLNNHIAHSTEAVNNLVVVLGELKEVIRGCPNNKLNDKE